MAGSSDAMPDRSTGGQDETFIRAVLDSLLANICVLDQEATITVVNQAWERFARENGDAAFVSTGVGINYLAVCRRAMARGCEDAGEALRGIEAILRGELSQFTLEYPCDSPSQQRWFLLSAGPLTGTHGRAVISHLDITQRRMAEEASRRSEMQYRALADSVPEIVFTADPLGLNDYCNRRWFNYTGLSPEQTRGEGWAAALHPDDAERALALWQEALRGGEPFECEYRFRRADGQYRWFLGRAVPLKDDTGRILKWFGNSMDIHDQKRMAEDLRTADRRKDEFLSTLAHEMRNPLAAIQSAVRIAQRPGMEAEQEWAREVVERQAQQLTRLIDDLLDVSRITLGKIELKKEPVEVCTVINRAVEVVRPLVEQRRHEITVALARGPLRVEADPARLEQVLVNLLTNAAKYMDEGGRIRLAARREKRDILIRVQDTGIGIAPEMLPRVFDLYAQVDHAHDHSQGGLGIGLALVQRLVAMHGGSVSVASEGLGRGSEFTVRLPAAKEKATAAPKPEAASHESPRTGLTILVVDDSRDTALALAKLLKRAGHEVEVAHDGPTALQMARDRRPRVVLLDIGLPGLDGYQVAAELRRTEGLEEAVLVAVSGYGQEQDRARSRAAGFDHHLIKPVNFDALFSLLGGVDPSRPQVSGQH
ncbi:MAG: ATP-binding protein [Planctomycetaceae bacterium]